MDPGLKRLLFVLLILGAGLTATIFMWSQGSSYAFAGLGPILGGLLLAVPETGRPFVDRRRLGGVLALAGWLTLGAVILLGSEGPRPVAYFVWAAICVGLFLLAVIADRSRTIHAAAALGLLFVFVRWSSIHSFATWGGSDSFAHFRYAGMADILGHMGAVVATGKYAAAPGMHMLVAMVYQTSGLSLSGAFVWSTMLPQVAAPLAVYALCRRNGRGIAGIAAVAVLALETGSMLLSLTFTPGGLALSFMAALVLLLGRSDLGSLVLSVVLAIATLVTHHLTTGILVVYATAIGVASLLSWRHHRSASLVPMLFAGILLVAFFVAYAALAPLAGVNFFARTVTDVQANTDVLPGSAPELATAVSRSVDSTVLYKITLVLGSALAVAAGARSLIAGGLDRVRGLGGLFLLGLSFLLPFLGVDLLADRWAPIAFVACLGGLGLLISRWSVLPQVAVALGVVALAFFGVTNPAVTHDQSFYSPERNVQQQFDEPDIAAVALAKESSWARRIYTDIGMMSLVRSHPGPGAYRLTFANLDAGTPLPAASLVVVREDLLEQNKLHFALPHEYALPEEPPLNTLRLLQLVHRVADEGPVVVYST